MHRGPQCSHAHQKITIAADRDRQPAGAFESQRGADRNAGTAANSAATIRADVIERVP